MIDRSFLPMKVGVLQFFSWPGRRGELSDVYARAMERVHIMDTNGYDAVWIAEHHFSTYSVCPSINMMGTHFAAHTKNLRIGTGVSLAAFYDPLRLAEEVALLDVLSGGRVNWGAGRGFDAKEFSAFGIDREESYPRFRENVDIVLNAWKSEKLTYNGTYHQYDEVEVLPKPMQSPHPPVWMAASSPDAVRWAGTEGFSIMMDPHSSMADIAAKQGVYRESLIAAGHHADGRDTPVARLLAVAPTEEAAREVAASGAGWTTGSYAKGGPMKGQADPVARYVNDVIMWGTPERVADQIIAHREEGSLNYLLCAPLSRQSFTLFNDEVLPRIL
jgi:alkanesulfonate monooxygenase SsuD/methylene tetrahydromethanopterin reductase-like flavin-dependent oxidoreductase (luciferase family)